MRKFHFVILCAVFAILGQLLFIITPVLAEDDLDEWYGTGYRDPEWILERGGTIIRYRIRGEEDSEVYKARMYLGEEMVEIEYGGRAYFDDAINNRYKVIIFKGKDKKMDADVLALPGQQITLKFDLDKKKVKTETEQVVPFNKIKLNSRSSRHISAADLGRIARVEPKATLPTPSSIGEADEEEVASEESPVEAVDSVGETIKSFEATFSALEAEMPSLFAALQPRWQATYVIFGLRDESFEEIVIALQEGEEALDELTNLAKEIEEGGTLTMLSEKITNAENFLAEQTERLERHKNSASVWKRLTAIW